MSLFDPLSYLILSVGVFAGAVVSGLVGFAFSAVAGGILLHVLPPAEAVPLMMACSIFTQAASLVTLRRSINWRGSLAFITGGMLGVVPALSLLEHIDARAFRLGFGLFLITYAAYMLLRPAATSRGADASALQQAAVGFGGGLVGGLTAMPGAIMTLWCDRRGLAKDEQRGIAQPYTLGMQVFAVACLLAQNSLPSQAVLGLALSLPAIAAGVGLGLLLFRRVNDAAFRTAVLVILMVSGVSLVV